MSTLEVLALAWSHVDCVANKPMADSARLCAEDAQRAYAVGDDATAKLRALRSLSYSVGRFHPDFASASA